jgi:hypothetical protein
MTIVFHCIYIRLFEENTLILSSGSVPEIAKERKFSACADTKLNHIGITLDLAESYIPEAYFNVCHR